MAADDDDAEHPRLILRNFLSLDLCRELEFIHKSCCTVGYRPNVFSTTLSHLIATNSAHLILPFISIRESLKEKAEEFFGCEYQLFVEFTGLISWSKGASIGWHSDDNRPYLKQRDFAAVCYLNSHGKDFIGGLFHFQDGEPTTVVPVAGDVIMYTADNRNIHSVDEIIDGERLTLTLWFSRNNSYDEDGKLISLLSQSVSNSVIDEPMSHLPLPAPDNMYWFSPDQGSLCQSGVDIRWARAHVLGYTFYLFDDQLLDSSHDHSKGLLSSLRLAKEDELFYKEFLNSLHALQVLQFCCWKAFYLRETEVGRVISNVVPLSQSLQDKSSDWKLTMGDHQLAEMVFHHVSNHEDGKPAFGWADLHAAVVAWEDYTCKLRKELFIRFPYWRSYQSIFFVPLVDLEKEA
ncbi:uncharacterized protein LOC122078583 isoform X2 [Macadamia integrifolia]|uniref:uncharacterized protein LOC122078583 isoform X2 n=1 Tax=Macadamia integrifolia TaxID=60698 RepID=UPI001C4E6D87|nr:uncharacterized protein LOC122078583 isoform X2 [Macadamia integrifolia]